MTKVYIVTGAPGAGKTTFVRKEMREGDLVIDFDAIMSAISGLPWYEKPLELLDYGEAVRKTLLSLLAGRTNEEKLRAAWVITSEARVGSLKDMKRFLRAEEVIVLETSPSECLNRIRRDERRKGDWKLWEPIVAKWWRTYEGQ